MLYNSTSFLALLYNGITVDFDSTYSGSIPLRVTIYSQIKSIKMAKSEGIMIVKVEDFKVYWDEIRHILMRGEWYCEETDKKILDQLRTLPESIENMTDKEIIAMLSIFKHCDSPYLYQNNIILTYGEDIPIMPFILGESVWGYCVYIKTQF